MALNRSADRCLIPVGRHSFMNGVFNSPNQLSSEHGRLAFVDQLMTFFGAISGVEAWASAIVRRNLTALGFDADRDTQLADYFDAVKRSSLLPKAAFEALVSDAAGRVT